jgi:hypothetical protein
MKNLLREELFSTPAEKTLLKTEFAHQLGADSGKGSIGDMLRGFDRRYHGDPPYLRTKCVARQSAQPAHK